MKLVIMLLSAFLTTSSLLAQQKNHGMGNGGGIICIDSQCKTLVDSGLVLSSAYPNFWVPKAELIKLVNSKIEKMPFSEKIKGETRKIIFLKLSHFKAVEIIDQAKLNNILELYKSVLIKNDPNFDFSNFRLAALSSDDTSEKPETFLLPDFFKLDLDSQAQVLIHEGFYRGRKSSFLKFVLQLDFAISWLTKHDKSNYYEALSHRNTILFAAKQLNILDNVNFFTHLINLNYSKQKIKKDAYLYPFGEGILVSPYSPLPFYVEKISGKKYFKVDAAQILSDVDLDERVQVVLLNLDSLELHNEFSMFIFRLEDFYKINLIEQNNDRNDVILGFMSETEKITWRIKNLESIKFFLPE